MASTLQTQENKLISTLAAHKSCQGASHITGFSGGSHAHHHLTFVQAKELKSLFQLSNKSKSHRRSTQSVRVLNMCVN